MDVRSTFERLKLEVRGGGRVASPDGGSSDVRPSPRADADRLSHVAVDGPIDRRPGVRGTAAYALKRGLRPLLSWYVRPFAAQQQHFNRAVLRALDDLEGRLAEPGSLGGEPASEPAARGSGHDDERLRSYVDDFRDSAPVLHVRCGRGELLRLLRDAGIEAYGIDRDPELVSLCRGVGLAAEVDDAVSHLDALPEGELGGIFCDHVLERLPPSALLRLLDRARATLRPGGLLVAEARNPRSLVSLSSFYADPARVRPLDPELLSALVERAGFRDVRVRYLDLPDEGRLRDVPLPGTEELEPARASLEANLGRLNEVVFGPESFALLGRA